MSTTTNTIPKLSREAFGIVYMSAGFRHRFGEQAASIAHVAFEAFRQNDWGGTCEEDQQTNAEYLEFQSGRLMASYEHDGTKYWVISNFNQDPEKQQDPDYCNTCILLPEDY